MTADAQYLDALMALAPRAFVEAAYQTVLGRSPTASEAQQMLSSLMQGDSRAWLVGKLRYGIEGRLRGVRLPGLRPRYAVHQAMRARGVGPALAWLAALVRLPSSLRRIRGIEQRDAAHQEALGDLEAMVEVVRARVDSIFPPALDDVLEIRGTSLVAQARERFGLSGTASLRALTPHERYAMFETVFYESPLVTAKQRVYVRYLNLDRAERLPFLDLGCGRGEFLRILRDASVIAVGVDMNPICVSRLRQEGFDIVEADLLAFLEADRRTYSGASLLQVVEHLTDDQIERLLALVAKRLAPGAVFIIETPNPLSPFAMSVFHTDSTHLRPLPPERLRYQVEAAGFEQARTLFQGRIPRDQFGGPDPRAYFMDYAIIASRSSS